MRVTGSAPANVTRFRGAVVFLGAAVLASSCVVYTPDLLKSDAVSLGGAPSSTASPAPAIPSPSQLPTAATPNSPVAPASPPSRPAASPLQRTRFAPEQLGAFFAQKTSDEQTAEESSTVEPWLEDAGRLANDGGSDAGAL